MLGANRIYTRVVPFTWTCASFACASYAYLVGASLASIGNTWTAILGYWAGTALVMAIVALTVGVPSFRYGIDTADSAKSALGVRGALLLMVGIVFSCIGWGNVLVAMTTRTIATLITMSSGSAIAQSVDENLVVLVGIGLVVSIWSLAARGPQMVAGLSRWCVPGQLILALLLLILLLLRYSTATLLHAQIPPERAITLDPHLQLTLAIEFGMNNGFTMVPFLGGIARLAASRRMLVTPVVGGYSLGAGFISGVAALATAASGSTDPLQWLTTLAGPLLGGAIMLFLVVANVAALVAFIYLAAISIQQLHPLSRLPWKWIIALVLMPSLIVAFKTRAVLEAVMELLTYNGVMFVGVTAVLFADFYWVRRGRLRTAHLFTVSPNSAYYYTGGINWLAMMVILGTTVCYFELFNPVSLVTAPAFRPLGAALPLTILAAAIYYVATALMHKSRAVPVDSVTCVELKL